MEVVDFIGLGMEGNLSGMSWSAAGEDKGREAALSGFGSREEGRNGILYKRVSNERRKRW
jgi:hypothetical protein